MLNLLSLNGYIMPESKSYSVEPSNLKNEFESESGKRTIEYVRTDIYTVTATYDGITQEKLKEIKAAVKDRIVTVKFYNPLTDAIETITGEVQPLKTTKVYYKNNINVWSVEIKIEEL